MSTEGFKVQASVKDTDGDMVNFRADSPEELSHYLTTFPYVDYAAAKASLRGAGAASAIVAPVQQAAPQQQWSAPAQQQPAPQWATGAQQAPSGPQNGTPHPTGQVCPVDGQVLQYKQITAKATGKTFKMWACPNQRSKGDGHTSEFID